jgi:fructose-bisphosphate aldolase class II
VNDYGNATQTEDGSFIKLQDEGVSEEVWQKMLAYAAQQNWSAGDFKKLNLPFETLILSQPKAIRERMVARVEEFVFKLLTEVFNAEGTGTIGKQLLLENGGYDLPPRGQRIEDPAEWTREKIVERAATLDVDKGPEGDFDD